MSTIHRTGGVQIKHAAVALTGSVPTRDIRLGDPLAYLTTSNVSSVYPASAQAFDTNLATTQTAFVAAFMGMSEGNSRAASTDARDLTVPVNIAPDAVYEGDMNAAADLEVGDLIGPAANGTTSLKNTYVQTSTKATSIGVVIEDRASSTRVLFMVINQLGKK